MTKLKFKKVTFLKLLINTFFFCNFFFYKFLFIYTKLSKNLTAEYYQQDKERLQKKACERYQNISKEEKEKMPYFHERYKNLSKDEKQKLAEFRTNII